MVTIFPVISGVHTTSRGLPEYTRDTRIDDGTEKGLISPFKIKSTSSLDHTTRKAKHVIVKLTRYSLGKIKDIGPKRKLINYKYYLLSVDLLALCM